VTGEGANQTSDRQYLAAVEQLTQTQVAARGDTSL
jgi:hypothetical protein